MIAFVDESMRVVGGGLYVVAAVVATDLDEARLLSRSVLLPRQERFHWRDESDPQRRKMLDQVAALASPALAYMCRPVPVRRQVRARALCIRRLVWDLRVLGVEHVVFESREPHNDRKDRATIAQAQRAGEASARLVHRFERPETECLLWLPDAVAGAVAATVNDEAIGYLDVLGPALRVVELDP